MKRTFRTAIAAALASLCLGASAGAEIVTFQIPGTTNFQPLAINDKGQVTGIAVYPSAVRGFLRQPDGTVTIFDAGPSGTYPAAISPAGVITGWSPPVFL